MKTHGTAVLDLDAVDRSRAARRATDVEGTHGQLGARLTDGLRRNDTDRLALADLVAARKLTPVALYADAMSGFAGHRRTHLEFVDTQLVDQLDLALLQQGSIFDQYLAVGIFEILLQHATEHALAEVDDDIAAFDDGTQHNTLGGAAVVRVDDQVL